MAEYAIVPNIDAPELTGIDIAVWAALCRYAQWELVDGKPVRSKPGTCFPSIQGLSNTTRFGKTAVCASLKNLERLGYIARAHRQKGNAFNTTEYTLVVVRQTNKVVRDTNKGCSPYEQGCSPREQGLFATRTQTNPYNKLNNKPIEQEAEVKAAAADHVSLGQVAEIWNAKLAPLGFPTVMKDTPARQKAFKARLNESPERHTLEWWRGLMARIEGAEFLVNSAKGKARWLTFDWILNENNLVKILEGRYDKRQEAHGHDSPKREQEAPPQTWAEAVARYRHKHGYDKEDGDNAGTGLICIS